MALIFAVDGEEGNAALAWTESNSTSHDSTHKDGTYAILQSDAGFYAKKTFASTYTEWFGSIFVRHSTANQNVKLLSWYSAGTTELGSIRWNATSKHFEIYTGTSTLQATGTANQQAANGGGDWYNLNFRILLHASTGNIAIRHEGSTSADATFTGNTLPSGSNMDSIQVAQTSTHDTRFDNFFLCDTSGSQNNTWPGVVRAYTDRPTGKSATNDSWTADSGSNKYDRINESTWNSTTYVYSESTGQKQGFTYPSLTFSGTILAMVVNDVAEKISSGGIKQGVRIAGTDYPSSTKALKTTVTRESLVQEIFELNPNTSGAWSTSDNPETYLEKTA